MTEATLREAILAKLGEVIDPETGVDVMRMRLIEDLQVDEETGKARRIERLRMDCA